MTTTELGPSWSDRLNPRNWTLAWKLVAIGLVPALLALALGVLRIADQADDAAALGSSNRLLEIRGQVSAAADALRQERDEAVLFVAAGRSEDRGVLDIGIGQTDSAVADSLAAVRAEEGLDNTTTAALAQTEEALAQLGPLRDDVRTSTSTEADAVVQRYTGVIARVDGLDRALLRQLRTPDVAGLTDALTAATSAGEQLAIQHTVLGAAIRAGQLRPADVAASVAADNRLASEISTYEVALTPEQIARFGTFGGIEANGELTRVKDLIVATDVDRPVVVDPAEWDAAYATALAAVQNASGLIRDEVVVASAAAEETASNLAGINSVFLMLGLLVGITIAVLVARALIRSLRVLRTSALDVAERRLPQAVESMRAGETPDVTVDPVPLDTRDEVGQVARAFDAVHGQAIRLAADQAALQTNVSSMFVNLSRRSQALVERQLQLIEQLESNEQDPDQLSNLFQLDHLATRMRRNSENLLVLAGTDLAKRNIAPVPMVDVLRAAVSEIEQYQRIVVQAPPTTAIVGRAASDLVHLLAELLDNATNFSPPDSQVVMSTTRTADGSILVEIADRGVGMIDYELADANQRLGGPSAVDVSASRRMGLFVVGRLGTRHGIQVQLSTSSAGGPGAGLTASVTVPAHLVPTTEAEQARPARVPVPSSAPSAFDVPPQRGAGNGAGRSGSLSALVAGADGPMTPPSAFDSGPPAATPFSVPNGSGTPSLPTRRPGSSLNPDGPGGSDVFGRADDPDRAAAAVAEQARQDQLAAERADAAREGRTPDDRTPEDRTPEDGGVQDRAPEGDDPVDRDVEKRDTENRDTENRDTRNPDVEDIDSDTTVHTTVGTDDADAAPEAGPNGAVPHVAAHALHVDHDPASPTNGSAPRDAEPDGDPTGPAARQDASSGDGRPAQGGRHTPWPNGAPPHGPTNGVRPSPRPSPRHSEPAAGTPRATDSDESDRRSPSTGTEPAGRPAQAQSAQAQSAQSQSAQSQSAQSQSAQSQSAQSQSAQSQSARSQPRPAESRPVPAVEQVAPPTAPIQAVNRGADTAAGPPRVGTPTAGAPNGVDRGPAPAVSSTDGLFAPSVPAAADGPPSIEPPAPPAAAPAAPVETMAPRPETTASGFEMGETTPIFEEIASAWFRSNRPLPVDYDEDEEEAARTATPPPAPQARPRPAAAHPAAPVFPPAPAAPPARRPRPQPVAPVQSTPPPAAPPAPQVSAPRAAAPRPAAAPAAQAAAEPSGFASTADEGWRAAGNPVPVERPDELTAAGLPKRRPRARLVPGSAGSAVLAPPVSPARSAENVRGRLASYQQGVRQGRESRYRGDDQPYSAHEPYPGDGATEPASAGSNHDEERT